jgi:hypothetical protein
VIRALMTGSTETASSTTAVETSAPTVAPTSCPTEDAVRVEKGAALPCALQRERSRLPTRGGNRQGGGPALDTRGSAFAVGCGSSPPLPASTLEKMPARKRPVKVTPTPPDQDVRKLQKKLSEEDFLRDLDRASTNRSAEKLEQASRRDPASPKT